MSGSLFASKAEIQMKNLFYFVFFPLLALVACHNKSVDTADVFDIPLDSIVLSDPCVLADSASGMYYMTGTGGRMWKSRDLAMWSGPHKYIEVDSNSWMGSHPAVWAAELHHYSDKYYCFATFTNEELLIDSVNRYPRRASHVLVSDTPDGPYRSVSDKDYLPADQLTLDGTLWVEDDVPYMVYCGEWLQNGNGTMEAIQLLPDFSSSIGDAKVLFRASDNPWSHEVVDGKELVANRVTDGPWLFRTATGRLGMIWSTWNYHDYCTGVAYSASGRLEGPWIQHERPITPPNYGHGMIFRDFNGRTLLSIHSHDESKGYYDRRPVFMEIDLSSDTLRIK